MSIRPFVWLAALLAVMGLAGTAKAQKYEPFFDPGYFGQPDFQYFAPAEVGDFGGEEPPNTGIYFDYDRTYVNMTRPEGLASLGSEFDGDFTWGNRWEIGFMTEEHTGWQAVLWHLSGPNEYVDNFQERLTRFNPDDDPANPDPIIQDRNPRSYILRDSLNVASLSSFELNKTWRRKQFHNGAVLEPLVGFRYMNFRSFFRRDNYIRFDENAAGEPVFPPSTVDGTFEQLTEDTAVFENFMIGGQLGARCFRQTGHWLLSADVRVFAVQNFQTLSNQTDVRLTRHTGVSGGADPDVELEIFTRSRIYDHAQEFVWGGEVRAEASYELTRDINLRFGMVFLDLGQGIGRGNDIHENFEDVQIAGLTFGFTINR
jgi:hypothetical protein